MGTREKRTPFMYELRCWIMVSGGRKWRKGLLERRQTAIARRKSDCVVSLGQSDWVGGDILLIRVGIRFEYYD